MNLPAIGGLLGISALSLGLAAALSWLRVEPGLRRTAAAAKLASNLGWRFDPGDVFEHDRLPFLRLSEGGRASNTLLGSSGARATCVFDWLPARGAPLTCVLTDLGTAWPHLLVQPRTGELGRRPQPSPLSIDPGPGLQPVDADDRVRVWSDDPAFAMTLVDDEFLDWLTRAWPDAHFELAGSLLLLWFPQLRPRRLVDAARAADALCSRIPVTVWSLYPVAE